MKKRNIRNERNVAPRSSPRSIISVDHTAAVLSAKTLAAPIGVARVLNTSVDIVKNDDVIKYVVPRVPKDLPIAEFFV